MDVEDQVKWTLASERACNVYDNFSEETRSSLGELIVRIMQLKNELVDLTLSAGSAAICKECRGQCCLNGKYHFTVLDLLAYLQVGQAPLKPDFSIRPLCPYSSVDGCLMRPQLRPMTCVVFNCELIEANMTSQAKERLLQCEQELRDLVALAAKMTGTEIGRSLLLTC